MIISFADLTYNTRGLSSNTFPLGVSLVASYVKKIFGDEIDIEIFHDPEEFIEFLKNNTPKIACFSNFSWTLDISHEFAKKIKKDNPETIIVFGGPNFPITNQEQAEFLKEYNSIDFYMKGEGEKAFIEFIKELKNYNFDVEKFKKNNVNVANCHYLHDGKYIAGEMLPRMKEDLNDIPSPYLTGLMDKFFDSLLIPITQTVRGCPFGCTFCQEGSKYFRNVSRFHQDRVKEELLYISKRVNAPNLIIADSNFGMYQEDLKTCEEIREIKRKFKWPKYIEASFGKNQDTVLKSVEILEGGILMGAPIQSTDPTVLKNIQRANISYEKIIEITKKGESYGGNSFSEIILALPGDTIKAHINSMSDMIDLGINVVRSHQLLMLAGSEMSTDETREKFGIKTKFRLQPKCFGNFTFSDEVISCAEIDEVCIGNSTMSYEDYLKCRVFDLSVEMFYNNGVFYELKCFLEQQNIKTSDFIKLINEKIWDSPIKDLYDRFLQENEECVWDTKKDLEKHIKNPYMIDKYVNEGLRDNEQLKFRALSFFYRSSDIHKIAFQCAKDILSENGKLDEKSERYLDELFYYSFFRKMDLLNLDIVQRKKFSFNFIEISEENFEVNPFDFMEEVEIEFHHTDEQKELFRKYLAQYTNSDNGLGTILSRSNANEFYRKIRPAVVSESVVVNVGIDEPVKLEEELVLK